MCHRSSSVPGFVAGLLGIENQGGIIDHCCGSKSLFQRGGIYKRFETRSRLAPCLGDVIELVVVEIEAANERIDGAISRFAETKAASTCGSWLICQTPVSSFCNRISEPTLMRWFSATFLVKAC